MIIGTSSLYLSGYPVVPNDIDILTDAVTAKQIEQALTAYKVATQVKPNEKFRSAFSKYRLHNFDVELMGNLEVNTANGWVGLRDVIKKVTIAHCHDRAFKIPSYGDQLHIYTLFNRIKDGPILFMLRNR